MQVSYSRISTYEKCPYQFKLRYKDELQTIFDCEPQNPLIIGQAIHTGIENDVDTAVKEYFNAYPIIDDMHITEAMKMEYLIPKVKDKLPDGEHEVKIETEDFIGYIDLLVNTELDEIHKEVECDFCKNNNNCENYGTSYCPQGNFNKWYDIYDFKYSNNVDSYMQSAQLHLYKYFFEKQNQGKQIRNMYFVFIPKSSLRIKYKNKSNPRDETIYEFRKRCIEDLENKEIQIIKVDYQPNKVIEYLTSVKHCIEDTEYIKKPTRLCDWCEYKALCQKGNDYMILPSTERVEVQKSSKKKIWVYGQPYSGKTTFADQSPTPLNLNTDGNVKYVTMPRLAIKDDVTVEGRLTKRKFAWEIFKEAISDLEKGSDFETVVVDLLEDTYESCRLYMYDQLGITHESDDSFRAWDKVRTEYLSTIKRLLNLDYNVILISHEDTSKDLTKRGGDKITAIMPNLNEKASKKIAGMVDLVARLVVDGDKRTLNFKSDEVIFGGGRLQGVKTTEIPLSWHALCEVYDEAICKISDEETTEQQTAEETPTKKRERKKRGE